MRKREITELESAPEILELVPRRDVVLIRTDARYGDGVLALYVGKEGIGSNHPYHTFFGSAADEEGNHFVYKISEKDLASSVKIERDGSLRVPSSVVYYGNNLDRQAILILERAGLMPSAKENRR